MANVKWIKINVDMFDDEKIKIIQSMPEGDALLIVWIKLITLAGKTNDSGYVYIAENMPYTDEMLSVIMNKPLNTIRLALDTFIKLGMIENDVKGIYLLNFEKHQSLDKLEKIKEQNRLRAKRFRDKQKGLPEPTEDDVTLRITQSNAIDIDKDIEEDIDIEEEIYINNGPAKAEQNIISKKKLEEEFELLWKQYPNKQGKSNALKSYTKARIKNKVEYDTILDGLKKYLVYCEQNNDWYRPKNGSTWFNQECWHDDYVIRKEVNNNANNVKQLNKSSGSKYSQFSQ